MYYIRDFPKPASLGAPLATHGVGFATPRLPIRKDTHVSAPQHKLGQQRPHGFAEDVFLGRTR